MIRSVCEQENLFVTRLEIAGKLPYIEKDLLYTYGKTKDRLLTFRASVF